MVCITMFDTFVYSWECCVSCSCVASTCCFDLHWEVVNADDPPTNYRVSAGPKKFSFPCPSHSGGLFGASSSAQIQQELDVAAYEPACETALLTPTTSGSCQQQSSSRHNNLETLSKLDPLLHPALDPGPAVEEPSSPQDNSLVIPSPRVAPPGIAANSTVLSIRPTADAPTTGTPVIVHSRFPRAVC